jgi:hypothetical protein
VQNYPFNDINCIRPLVVGPALPPDLRDSDPAMTFGMAVGGR